MDVCYIEESVEEMYIMKLNGLYMFYILLYKFKIFECPYCMEGSIEIFTKFFMVPLFIFLNILSHLFHITKAET